MSTELLTTTRAPTSRRETAMACCCCAGSGKAVLQVSAPACESEKAHTHEGSTSCLGERPRARRGSDGELGLSLPHGSGDGSRRERRLSEGNIRPRGRRLSEASVASHHTASSVGEVISFRPGGEAIKAAFDLIDVDGSGSITRLEVQFAMQSLGLATDEQDLMMLMRR